ncbi:MAG: hypothetical protein RBR02_06380 [Desulfuromonadaceae bacterium]|nr:hypothetical protein [Desulfuromonadaceae bacterium]
MARVTSKPIRLNLPSESNIKIGSINNFKGLDLNDNHFNVDANSAKDILNLYVDDVGVLTHRPRIVEYLNIDDVLNFKEIYGVYPISDGRKQYISERYIIHYKSTTDVITISIIGYHSVVGYFTLVKTPARPTVLGTEKLRIYEYQNNIYILDGLNYYVITEDINGTPQDLEYVYDHSDTYIPTKYVGSTYNTKGTELEEENILVSKYKETFFWNKDQPIYDIYNSGTVVQNDYFTIETETKVFGALSYYPLDAKNGALLYIEDNALYIKYDNIITELNLGYTINIETYGKISEDLKTAIIVDTGYSTADSNVFIIRDLLSSAPIITNVFTSSTLDLMSVVDINYNGNIATFVESDKQTIHRIDYDGTVYTDTTHSISGLAQYLIELDMDYTGNIVSLITVDSATSNIYSVYYTNLFGTTPTYSNLVIPYDYSNTSIEGVLNYDGTKFIVNIKSSDNNSHFLLFNNFITDNTDYNEYSKSAGYDFKLSIDNNKAYYTYADWDGISTFTIKRYINTEFIDKPENFILLDTNEVSYNLLRRINIIDFYNLSIYEGFNSSVYNRVKYNVIYTYNINNQIIITINSSHTDLYNILKTSIITTRFDNNYWFASGNRDYFSKYNNPTYFPQNQYNDYGEENDSITGYNVIGDSILAVYKKNSMYVVTQTTVADVETYLYTEAKAQKGNFAKNQAIVSSQQDIPLQIYKDGIYALQIDNAIKTSERNAILWSTKINKKYLSEQHKENFITHNHIYWTYFIIENRMYVLDNRTNEWFYWELPDTPLTLWETDDNLTYYSTADGYIRYLTDEEYINPFSERTEFKDYDDHKIHIKWESQIMFLGTTINYKQLNKTGFIFVDTDQEDEFALDYYFKVYRDSLSQTFETSVSNNINLARSIMERTYVPKFMSIQIVIEDTPDEDINKKLNLVGITYKYKILRTEVK